MEIIDQRRLNRNVKLKNLVEGNVFLIEDRINTEYYVKGKIMSSGEEWAINLKTGQMLKCDSDILVTPIYDAELIIKE